MRSKICLLGTMALIASAVMVNGSAHAVPAPIAASTEEIGSLEMGVLEDIYSADGTTLLRTVTSPVQVVGYSASTASAVDDGSLTTTLTAAVAHATTGCHRIRGFITGYGAITGKVQWRYWNRTYSCWNKTKRLVTNVSNAVQFTDVTSVWAVTHNLLDYARYFYNPASSWDPFPLPGLNSHSAYYNWSKGEIEGTCGIVVQATCWMRPWVTVKSLYNGNWMVKGSNGTVKTG
jgi:hypothetical protein